MKNLGDTMRISGWGNCLMGISNIPWDRTFWKRSRYARSRLGTEWDTVFSVLEVVWVQRHKRNWIIIFMSLQSFRDPYFWVLEILYVYDFLIFFLKFLFVVVDHFKSLCWICYNISSVLCFVFFFFFFCSPDMRDLISLTKDQTCTPCIGRWNLNHWTTREVSSSLFLLPKSTHAQHQAEIFHE